MPRAPRITFENGFYHVYSRGVEKRIIFTDKQDYLRFLKTLEKLIKESDCSIYCYTLLPNHFHFLMETRKTSLSQFMARLLTSYSVYFNKRHKRVGPLFQNRFKSKLVQKDDYFLVLSRYIHLNPVKAGLIDDPFVYSYSSLPEYIDATGGSSVIVDRKAVTRLIGESAKTLKAYCTFIREGIAMAQAEDKEDIWDDAEEIVGSKRFAAAKRRKYLKTSQKHGKE